MVCLNVVYPKTQVFEHKTADFGGTVKRKNFISLKKPEEVFLAVTKLLFFFALWKIPSTGVLTGLMRPLHSFPHVACHVTSRDAVDQSMLLVMLLCGQLKCRIMLMRFSLP